MSGRPTLYLHIGAPKTGTTYLQQVIAGNRKRLAEDGVLRPGAPGSAGPKGHFVAVKDLETSSPRSAGPNLSRPGGWQDIIAQVRDWNGPSVISAENLAVKPPGLIARLLEPLDSVEVHIVYTARDLARQIPSVWQERLKNRESLSYADYLDAVMHPSTGHPTGAKFWQAQDGVEVLRRWSADIPPEHVHVVTVPRSPVAGDTLWDRFASVLGVDPSRYDTEQPRSNASLGAAEASVLRRLNPLLSRRFSQQDHVTLVKDLLAQEVLVGAPNEAKITLLPQYRPWVRARAEELVEGLEKAGYHVVGDLGDLLPGETGSGDEVDPDEIGAEEVLAASVFGLAGVLERVAATTARPPRAPESPALRRQLGRPRYRGSRFSDRARGRLIETLKRFRSWA